MPRYSLADVRRSYTPEKRWGELEGDLPSFLLYRPLSILLTPAALRLGISPTLVSLIGLMIALSLPVVAGWGGSQAYVAVAILALTHHVLDCLDGNIARTAGRSSAFGALFDGFADLVFWTCYLASIGLLAQRFGTGFPAEHGLSIGLILAILVLLHRQLRDSYALELGHRADFTPYPPPKLTALDWTRIALIGLERVYAFAILLGGALGVLHVVLAGIAVYVTIVFFAAVTITFGKALRARTP